MRSVSGCLSGEYRLWALNERLTMRRAIWFLGVAGVVCASSFVWWHYRRRRYSVAATGGAVNVNDRLPDAMDSEARWEDEGGALLLK